MTVPTQLLELDGPSSSEQGDPAGPRPVDYFLFIVRAGRRRSRVAISVFLAGMGLLSGYFAWKTPQYRVETRILAQRQQSLPSIVRSNVAEDLPTRAAWEIIHRRENLVALIKQAGLLEAAPKVDLLERVRLANSAPTKAQSLGSDLLDQLVILLDRRLKVEAGEVTIAIEIDWPDARQAYRIVDGALQNFLEARHVQEVTALDEPIATLEGRAAMLRDELASEVEAARRTALREAGRALPAAMPSQPPQGTSEELVRLKSMLDAKERAIADVEEFRRRRLADLQAQYDARRAVYSEMHPELINLRQDIASLSGDSPQITALREEERRLRQDYQARLAREPGGALAPARPTAEGISLAVDQSERVREARGRYQRTLESLNAAQLERDTARSAFKHRYQVIWPPQVPRDPVSPSPWKIFGVGGVAALLFALLIAAAVDYRSGRIFERWQIRARTPDSHHRRDSRSVARAPQLSCWRTTAP